MTIYRTFKEAVANLEDDIHENGQKLGNTIELTSVNYTVTDPDPMDLSPHLPWASIEFIDRVSGEPHNPGNAWKELPKVWEPMLEEHKNPDGIIYKAFSYTYSERMAYQLSSIIAELASNPESRQAYMAIWNPSLDALRLSARRVPC